jgi:uncharacterized membrane protein
VNRRNLDLIGANCFVVAGMLLVLLPISPLFVRVLLAVPLVFILPGYTLTQVLFPRRAAGTPSNSSQSLTQQQRLKISQRFSAVDNIVFSLGLSLVIDILTGLLLNLLPAGLQWQFWTLSLAFLTQTFALFAIFLRRGEVGLHVRTSLVSIQRRHLPYKEYSLLGLALAVVFLALWLSIIRPSQPQPSFTQFWMLASTQANKGCAVLIGVRSFELTPRTYRIQVARNGIQVASWPSIMLIPQQEWDRLVPVSSGVGGDAVVNAELYRLDQPRTIYREAHVTLHSC